MTKAIEKILKNIYEFLKKVSELKLEPAIAIILTLALVVLLLFLVVILARSS